MTLKEKIKNKEKLVGMYVELADISIAKMAGLAGYDYVWVDTEHTYMSYETLLGHIIALKASGTSVIVRASQDDLTSTKKILEIGVDGIIFPMVKTAEEANRLIASTLYPPHGNRGFGPLNATNFGMNDAFEYAKNSVDTIARFIQIEHRDTVENLDEIDKYITDRAIGWSTDRMTKVSLSVMRIAVYEMKYCDDIPFNVSINEAVEIVKSFDDDKAPAFVNGILNGVALDLGLKNDPKE